mgnify:CR=1 FL=1
MKKILLVTANRSDYGIQKNLIKLLEKEKKIKFYLVVTGAHLESRYGNTIKEIQNDKINIYKKIKISTKNYNPQNIIKIFSKGNSKFFNLYNILKPDLIIILGDRYEMLAAAVPSIFLNIPIAHIHGGEKTLGSFDDTIRNMITEIASLHFTCHDNYKKRVTEIKNSKKNVYNFGSLSIENIQNLSLKSKNYLVKNFNLKFGLNNILVTYHPETRNKNYREKDFKEILIAIKNFKKINFFFTLPSPDPGNEKIINLIRKFCNKYKNCYFVSSFGKIAYFSILKYVDGVIGNSSSGILEVPSFKIPTINIGKRQFGREQSLSILNCDNNHKQIKKNINKIFDKNFQKKIKKTKNIFFKKNSAKNTIYKIKKFINDNQTYKKNYC